MLEEGTRSLDPEHLVRYIDTVHRIGTRMLRTVLSGSLLDSEQRAAAESGIRQVVPTLDRAGVTLGMENNEAFSAAEFAGLVRGIRSPGLGICLDTANSLGRPETLETVIEHLAASYDEVLDAARTLVTSSLGKEAEPGVFGANAERFYGRNRSF